MAKLPVEEVKSYWNRRVKDSTDSWESILWLGVPRWNKYIHELQMHHLRKHINQIKRFSILQVVE